MSDTKIKSRRININDYKTMNIVIGGMQKVKSKKSKRKGKRTSGYLTGFLLVTMLLTFVPATASFAESGGSVDIAVSQVFTVFGTDATPDTGADYSLKANGDAPAPTGASGGEYTFSLTGNDSRTISISYDHAGVYEYRLSCSGAGGQGYTYDNEKYTVRVYVKNTESGGLDAEFFAEKSDGNKADLEKDENGNYCIVYKHRYCPQKYELLVDPPVRKAVIGKGAPKKDRFTFCLQADTEGAPMPEGSRDGIKTLNLAAGEEEDFGTWAYEEAGEYRYKVYEIDEGKDGYRYDKGIYSFVDKVTDDGGVLKNTRTYYDKNGKVISSSADAFSFAFTNEYKSTSHGLGKFVKTGDTAKVAVYIVAALAALLITIFLLIRRRRDNNERKGA